MKKNVSLNTVALITFSIDILAIAIAVSRAILLERSPMRYFGENGFITWISVLQLSIVAVICWKISTVRSRKLKSVPIFLSKKPVIFWRIMAMGMFFFALDEGLEIHENLDKGIHALLQQESTSFSGRLDDFIILFYAIAGLLIIYLFRKEFNNFIASFSWFIWGFFFSMWTIILDMVGHDRATFTDFANNLEHLNQIHHWFSAVEEMPKILAGGSFLVAFYSCFQISKKL